jgi:hypothetical protein
MHPKLTRMTSVLRILLSLAMIVMFSSLGVSQTTDTATLKTKSPRFKGKSSRHTLIRRAQIRQQTLNNFDSSFAKTTPWNIRTAPATFFLQWITLDLAYTTTQHWSLGPSLILYSAPDNSKSGMLFPAMHGMAFGFNLNYYFDGVSVDNWYLGHHSYYESYSLVPHGGIDGDKNQVDGIRSNLLAGYQWRWPQWNLIFGGGLELVSHRIERTKTSFNGDTSITNDQSSNVMPVLELKIGWFF